MTRRLTSLLILSFALVAFIAMTASAAKAPVQKRVINPRINKVMQYVLPIPDEHNVGNISSGDNKASLGRAQASTGASPGVVIGDTWYDYQHNGSMGRMIDRGEDGGEVLVHMAWMRLPENNAGTRRYQYNIYNAATGVTSTSQPVSLEWSGYVGVDATKDNRAVVGGHERPATTFAPNFYWDAAPGAFFFGLSINRVPDSVMAFGGSAGAEVIWPKFRYQETAPDTVTHVVAQYSADGAGDPSHLSYFRKIGVDHNGAWDYPPYIIDTVFDLSQDIACSETTGKVAIAWTANLSGAAVCDTNSGEQPFVQIDNDVYYQISDDQGVTWHPRVNVTCNVDGEAGYRPYSDLNVLITTDENLHLVWSGRVWPADANSGGSVGLDCRIFHFSEDIPSIRTVHNAEWDQTTCNGGAWQMNVSKMTVSECDGRLYVCFVQFNDIPNGVEDDCAQRGVDGSDVVGSANGEIWLSVSADDGLTWDLARNLTNSYTSGCDSLTGANGPCDSDHWPSMTRFGRENQGGENWSNAVVIDPSNGAYAGQFYLDMQWVNDVDAGGIVQDEGSWQLSNLHWARIPCVAPVPNPIPNYSLTSIDYPTWGKHGVQTDFPFVLENSGNVDLVYNVAIEEDNLSGWLAVSGFSGLTPSGFGNIENATVSLNSGGVVNTPGTTVALQGRLIFTGPDAPSFPDTVSILYYVADTLLIPTWDTLTTSCFALTVSTNGNFGNQGRGQVNLDYWNYGDCDTVDTVPGATDVYLYDGSPIIAFAGSSDTTAYMALFSNGFQSETGMRSITNHTPVTNQGTHNEYYTGVFTTADTTIAMEKTWFAPIGGNDCFMIQCLKIYSYDGSTHSGLSIGEGIDWDVPSDSGSDNTAGFDASRRLIYQIGAEFNQDDTLECLDNDTRYGGMAFLEKFHKDYDQSVAPDTLYVYTALSTSNNGLATLQANIDAASAWYTANVTTATDGNTTADNDFVGAFSLDNPTWVYPAGGFVEAEIYSLMRTQHETDQYVVFTDSITDLHMVMTYVNDFELGGEGCCIGIRGNANNDPSDAANVADVSYLVAWLFGIPSGPAPVCPEEANANNDPGGAANVADISYLVAWLFGIPSGPAPPACN